jgi:hypothetical protein
LDCEDSFSKKQNFENSTNANLFLSKKNESNSVSISDKTTNNSTAIDTSEVAKALLHISEDIWRVKNETSNESPSHNNNNNPPINALTTTTTSNTLGNSSAVLLNKRVAVLLCPLNAESFQLQTTPLSSTATNNMDHAITMNANNNTNSGNVKELMSPSGSPLAPLIPLNTESIKSPSSSLIPNQLNKNALIPQQQQQQQQQQQSNDCSNERMTIVDLDQKNNQVPTPILPSFIPSNNYLFPKSSDIFLRKSDTIR